MANADVLVSAELQAIAKKLTALLDQAAGGHHMAFSLLVWNTEAGGRMSYVSNCKREDSKKAMQELVEKWDTDAHGAPAHLYN